MTEAEYINVRMLAFVDAALDAVRHATSYGGDVAETDLATASKALSDARDTLDETINVSSDD